MKITALSISHSAAWANGDRLLAFFSVEFAGLRMHDCLLIRASRGFLIAQTPRYENKRGDSTRAIEIVDPEIRKAMAGAAHNAYVALGGEG